MCLVTISKAFEESKLACTQQYRSRLVQAKIKSVASVLRFAGNNNIFLCFKSE